MYYPSWEVKVLSPLDSNILSSAYYTIIQKVSKKINKIQANIMWFNYKLAITYCKNIGMQYVQTHTS